MAGRPSELTDAVIVQVATLLPQVMYLETVASLIGIDRRTMRTWIKRGAKEQRRLRNVKAKVKPQEAIYLAFHVTIKKGLADGEKNAIDAIQKAKDHNWQAGAWLLERRHPEKWGRDRQEVAELRKQVADLTKLVAAVLQKADP